MRAMKTTQWVRVVAIVAVMGVTIPAFAYKYPLTSTSIREAYFLGSSTNGTEREIFAEYAHRLPELTVGVYFSSVTIETPYTQVAQRARAAFNYTTEDAIEEFLAKPPAMFRVRVLLCRGHAEAETPKVMVSQAGATLVASEFNHWPHHAAGGGRRATPTPIIGEYLELEFAASKIEAAPLTIEIETSDGRRAQTAFDLDELN